MGDSCITLEGNVSCSHSVKQVEYIQFKYDLFKGLGARLSTEYKTSQLYTKTGAPKERTYCRVLSIPRSHFVDEIYAMTTQGRQRVLSKQVLEEMGELGFCLWFLDDGSMYNRTKKKGKLALVSNLATNGFQPEEVVEAVEWLKHWFEVDKGISLKKETLKDGSLAYSIAFSMVVSRKIADMVARNVPASAIPGRKHWLKKYCAEKQATQPAKLHDTVNQLGIVPVPVKSISSYVHDKPGVLDIPVYDFTVEDTHRYTLAGGVLCSNSKRYGTLETSALVGHQAFDTLLDAAMIRGQSNADFWRSIRTGEIPTIPGEPLVHRKFFAHLTGSGVNVRKTPKGISVFSLSNDDVKELAGPRELKSKDTYEARTFRPIDGGLFGQDLFGPNGDRWAYIQLDEPLPNPVMEEPLARLLRMSTKDFMAVAAGKAEVNGMKSSADIKERLSKINLEAEEKQAQREFKDAPMSKKDAALKRYRDIARMKANEVPPDQYMLDRIPVLPPIYRPVSTHNGLTMVADSNYLYAQMMDARDDMREAKNLPEEYQQQARENLYRSWKELTGMYEPENVKLKNKHVQGLLKWALGNSPKCYDDETDILTRDGWVKFSEYNGDCEVATVNPVTDAFEWQQPLDVIHAKGPSEMVQIKTRVLDSLVTGNHEHYVSVRRRHNGVAGFDTYEKLRADYLCEHPNRMRQKTAASSYEGQKPVPPIPVEDLVAFSEFVGWYIADGWVHSKGNSVIVEVKEGTTKDHQLHALFTRIGCEYKRLVCVRKTASTRENTKSLCDVPVGYATVRYAIYAKELKAWILANIGKGAKNKTISATVLSWSSVYLKALLKGLLLGDGSKRRHTDKSAEDKQTWHNRKDISDSGVALNTTSAALVDAVQELGAKIGIHMAVISAPYTRDRATPLYRISVHAFDYAMVEGGKQVYKTPYTGLVHCVTVPNGLIITRRNGKVLVSGNSSAFQRKVLGSTVDTVGRGVIAPDPRLKLNQLGVPVPMALGIFEPFVARAMVKQGYTPVEALKMIKARDKRVMPVLVDVMKHSPVQLNRAPSLHKLNIMGFEPVLVAGHAVKVNPSIVVPFAADFDGDSILNMVEIVIDLNILAKKIEHIGISGLTSLEKAVSCLVEHQKKESTMIAKDQRALYATACAPLCELPTVPGSEVRKSDTVTEWDVQEGFYTYTKDPVTGDTVLAPITKVSRHLGLTMMDCTISQCGAFTKVVTASDDHSLITLNPMTLELEKTKPVDAVGRCVPRVRYNAGNDPNVCARYMDMGRRVELTYDLGVFIGMMLGDGWVDAVGVVRLACCDRSLQQYILEKYTMEDAPIPMRKNAELFVYPPVEDRFSDKDRARFTLYLPPEMRDSLKSLIGTGAKNKRVPEDCFMASRSHITGILMGLLATDGAVTYSTGNKSRKAATKTIAIHTVSPLLRDGIQELASRIGIRTSATPYKGVNSVETCYAVTLSLEDVAREAKKHPALFRIPMARKQEALEKIVADVLADEGSGTSSNIHVPFPRGLFGEFSYAKVATMCPAVIKARATGHIQRKYALTLADMMEKVDWSQYSVPSYLAKKDRVYRTPKEAETLVKKWIAMVRDEETDWCIVTAVTPSSCTEGWDCTVPGPYTFALFDGTVVQDTANVHAPVSDNARRETYEKMFPERNLISMRNRQILYKPEKEYMQGLYVATRMKKGTNQRPRIFSSVEEARQALRKGIIDIDDPIEIRKQ